MSRLLLPGAATPEHRATQTAGRKGILQDYRLCVGVVVCDYGLAERREQVAPTGGRFTMC